MSEDDVKAELNQQTGTDGGRADKPSVATPPSAGSGSGSRPGGLCASGLGPRGEPNQLLVLVGDEGGACGGVMLHLRVKCDCLALVWLRKPNKRLLTLTCFYA